MDHGQKGREMNSGKGEKNYEERSTGSSHSDISNNGAIKMYSDKKSNNSYANSSDSRSRSRQRFSESSTKSWTSSNAWLNFMQDFRSRLNENFPITRSADIFRLASSEWSEMSSEDKQPYIDAANRIKMQKQLANDDKRRNKSKTQGNQKKSDHRSKVTNQKVTESDEATKEKNASDSDSDSASEMEDSP